MKVQRHALVLFAHFERWHKFVYLHVLNTQHRHEECRISAAIFCTDINALDAAEFFMSFEELFCHLLAHWCNVCQIGMCLLLKNKLQGRGICVLIGCAKQCHFVSVYL